MRAPRLCSYEFCQKFKDVPLVRGERRYHREPCKALADRAKDRERYRKDYGDRKRKCLQCGETRNLLWSLFPDAWPYGMDSYLYREAVLCSDACLIGWFDDRPELAKPDVYFLIKGIPEEDRPKPIRYREKLYGDWEEVERAGIVGAGHAHYPGRHCQNCAL